MCSSINRGPFEAFFDKDDIKYDPDDLFSSLEANSKGGDFKMNDELDDLLQFMGLDLPSLEGGSAFADCVEETPSLPEVVSSSLCAAGDDAVFEDDFKCVDELPFGLATDSDDGIDSGLGSDDASGDQQLSPVSLSCASPLSSNISSVPSDAGSDVSSTSDFGLTFDSPTIISTPKPSPVTLKHQQLSSTYLNLPPKMISISAPSLTQSSSLLLSPSRPGIRSIPLLKKVQSSPVVRVSAPKDTTSSSHDLPLSKPSTVFKLSPVLSSSTGSVKATYSVVNTAAQKKASSSSSSSFAPLQTFVVHNKLADGAQPRNITLMKTTSGGDVQNSSKSILLPVALKDLSQFKTIKIISNNGKCMPGTVRTLLSSGQPTVSSPVQKSVISDNVKPCVKPYITEDLLVRSIKTEPIELEDKEDGNRLILSDEEKCLMKKEGLVLPTHFPLTKHEERELKRIKRKIRNKISAQDSRKRKKEYIDGLEDRVKSCTEVNQQLQKRIRHLEAQNESLVSQLRRFQTLVTGGIGGRSQSQTSTALMMLILSAALFVMPSLRSQDTEDNELGVPNRMPAGGHSRSLLESTGKSLTYKPFDPVAKWEDVPSQSSISKIPVLSDHDYSPVAKRMKTSSLLEEAYFDPPLDDVLPDLQEKIDPGGSSDPPDPGASEKLVKRIVRVFLNHIGNFSEWHGSLDSQGVIVDLGRSGSDSRRVEEIEVE